MSEQGRACRSVVVAPAIVICALAAGTAHASLIWDGDPSRGLGVFGNMNCDSPGSVTPFSDATQGTVWRYNKPNGSNRCENHGISVNGSRYVFQNNTTYYLGWRSRLTSVANNNANFQWKSYGSHTQNYPILLKMIGGKMNLMYREPGVPCCRTVWSRTISKDTWYSYVLAIRTSSNAATGWMEFWFDGVQQTLTNGTTRYPGRTLDDINEPKWGIYGASDQAMANFVDALKVGTTYADVAPEGGPVVTPTPTPTPTVTPTATPRPTSTPTPTPPTGIFEITPIAVSASTNDGNVPGNSVDGNLNTRWSGSGNGAWIQYELGGTYNVGRVTIATYQGNTRQSRFDIQVSTGGEWTPVLANAITSGTTTMEETFNFTAMPATRIRYIGHGNTSTTKPEWNSLTEVSIFAVP